MRRKPLPLEIEDSEEALLNLTPLIDVVFVLLITFLLVSPMLHVDHVDLASCGSSQQTDFAKDPLTISLRKDDTIWLDGSPISFSDLRRKLQEAKDKKNPQLMADKQAHFGIYQDIKNLLEDCGFSQMDVVLQ